MSEGSNAQTTNKSDESYGLIVVIFVILAIASWFYTLYGRIIDYSIVIVGFLSLVLSLLFYFKIAIKYNIQFDRQEMVLIPLLQFLWVPIITTPLWDLVIPSTDYIVGGVRMVGLILILLVLFGNMILNFTFISLYEKSYQLRKPNFIEIFALKYYWLWIGIMYFMTILGFLFGTGLYLSLFGISS